MIFRSRSTLIAACVLLAFGAALSFNRLSASARPSPQAPHASQPAQSPGDLTFRFFLPLVHGGACHDLIGESYGSLVVNPPPTDRPAEQHADLNLALRGYSATAGTLALVDYGGAADSRAPQLYTLFTDNRLPAFAGVSQVFDWDWSCNCGAGAITDPPVTLLDMTISGGETQRIPASGYNIGTQPNRPARGVFLDAPGDDPNAYEVLVLYATPERVTFKYTREDNVVQGYTLHVEDVCVAPDLLSLYNRLDDAGRAQLPALKAGQAFATGRANTVGAVIRDQGSFMDPRSHKDWWQGK